MKVTTMSGYKGEEGATEISVSIDIGRISVHGGTGNTIVVEKGGDFLGF